MTEAAEPAPAASQAPLVRFGHRTFIDAACLALLFGVAFTLLALRLRVPNDGAEYASVAQHWLQTGTFADATWDPPAPWLDFLSWNQPGAVLWDVVCMALLGRGWLLGWWLASTAIWTYALHQTRLALADLLEAQGQAPGSAARASLWAWLPWIALLHYDSLSEATGLNNDGLYHAGWTAALAVATRAVLARERGRPPPALKVHERAALLLWLVVGFAFRNQHAASLVLALGVLAWLGGRRLRRLLAVMALLVAVVPLMLLLTDVQSFWQQAQLVALKPVATAVGIAVGGLAGPASLARVAGAQSLPTLLWGVAVALALWRWSIDAAWPRTRRFLGCAVLLHAAQIVVLHLGETPRYALPLSAPLLLLALMAWSASPRLRAARWPVPGLLALSIALTAAWSLAWFTGRPGPSARDTVLLWRKAEGRLPPRASLISAHPRVAWWIASLPSCPPEGYDAARWDLCLHTERPVLAALPEQGIGRISARMGRPPDQILARQAGLRLALWQRGLK